MDIRSVYEGAATKACERSPTVRVAHEELVSKPWQTLARMFDQLRSAGVPIHATTDELDHKLRGWLMSVQQRGNAAAGNDLVVSMMMNAHSSRKRQVDRSAAEIGSTDREISSQERSSRFQWPPLPSIKTGEAYATIVTGAAEQYLWSACVLGFSIQLFDPTRHRVAVATEQVPASAVANLQKCGWMVRNVPTIPEPWYGKAEFTICNSPKNSEAEFAAKGRSVRWGRMMSKLHLWNLVEYSKVLYFDVDVLITGPVDILFDMLPAPGSHPTTSRVMLLARRGHAHGGFNAGIMALLPSRGRFDRMLNRTQKPPPARQAGDKQVGPALCTEQALLNDVIPLKNVRVLQPDAIAHPHVQDWKTMNWSYRPYRNGTGWPLLFHWVGCPKPWELDAVLGEGDFTARGTLRRAGRCDAVPYMLWWRWAHLLRLPATNSGGGARLDRHKEMHINVSRLHAKGTKLGKKLRDGPSSGGVLSTTLNWDAYCNRLGGILSKTLQVCCKKKCGTCGGNKCSIAPGGNRSCCKAVILREGKMCTSHNASAPCYFAAPTAQGVTQGWRHETWAGRNSCSEGDSCKVPCNRTHTERAREAYAIIAYGSGPHVCGAAVLGHTLRLADPGRRRIAVVDERVSSETKGILSRDALFELHVMRRNVTSMENIVPDGC